MHSTPNTDEQTAVDAQIGQEKDGTCPAIPLYAKGVQEIYRVDQKNCPIFKPQQCCLLSSNFHTL